MIERNDQLSFSRHSSGPSSNKNHVSRSDASGQKIIVTLLLKGGYQRCVKLDAADPSLTSLFEVVAKRNSDKTKVTVFNLEMEDGEGSLFFTAADLIALSTNPAISIDLRIESTEIDLSHVIKENYLSKECLAALLKFVDKHAAKFKPMRIKEVGNRRSASRSVLVLEDLGEFGEMFRERLRSDIPAVLAELQIPKFQIAEIECQINAYRNNHYIERHLDSGWGAPSRIVSFIYHFYAEPRRFKGGALRLYTGKLENGVYEEGRVAVDIDPRNNTMLCFPSVSIHEVLPIKSSFRKFIGSRFAVIGWVRRLNDVGP
jgi:hypothetical protein